MTGFSENASAAEHATAIAEWESMLDAFRALGGEANNVLPRHGPWGRGLVSKDPAKPFVLRIPANLFFRVHDIEFARDAIRIGDAARVARNERNFFEQYQEKYSWGGGGKGEAERLVSMFDALPAGLRAILCADFAMQDLLEGDHAERTQRWFLKSRAINWQGGRGLVPLLDLANRGGDGFSWSSDQPGFIAIEGHAADEIRLNLGANDSVGVFRRFGIAVARPHAFSLPMTTKIGTGELAIERNLSAKAERGGFDVPEVRYVSGRIVLSQLMLGNASFPRAPRGIFDTLMRESGATGAADSFDRVLQLNRRKFLDLLEALEPLQGELIATLRSVAHFQLEALAHCVGTRAL